MSILTRALALSSALAFASSYADSVDDVVAKFMAARHVPAVAVLVLDHGKVVKQSVYGQANIELSVPATTKTLFQIGSIGKMFTAVGILKLAQEGKLSLDDKLSKFFPFAPDYWNKITLRHMMTHTSGIPDYSTGPITVDIRKEYTEDEMSKFAASLKPDFEPGTQWAYSNTNFMLLGNIIHKLTGKFYADYLKEVVFDPAGMKTIRPLNDREIIPNRAAGYDWDTDHWLNQDWMPQSANSTADGTLYATTDDFVAWDQALNAMSVLPSAVQEEAWTSARLKDGSPTYYGYGWSISSRLGFDSVWHNGAYQGFMADYVRYKDGLSVVVFMNVSNINPGRLVADIVPNFRDGLDWQHLPAIAGTPASDTALKTLEETLLAGKFDASKYAGKAAGAGDQFARALPGAEKRYGALLSRDLLFSRKLDEYSEFAFRLNHEKGASFVQMKVMPDGKIMDIDYELGLSKAAAKNG